MWKDDESKRNDGARMSSNLVVVIMGQNCEKFLPMCLESVKDADAIVYCDGGSNYKTFEVLKQYNIFEETIVTEKHEAAKMKFENRDIIKNEYKQDDPQMNGKQRNFYLNYVKEKYPDWYCLALDADEVVEDLSKIKELITKCEEDGYMEKGSRVFSVKMRHFQEDLGHEDTTQPQHFVPNRLFKISDAKEYPLGEHVILVPHIDRHVKTICTTIWHLAHIEHCFNIKKRYDKNLKHSNIHSKEFLNQWYLMHLLGEYPSSRVNPLDVPGVIWEHFGISKDLFYFMNRGIEVKHFIMTKQWDEYFDLMGDYNDCVIEFGCGKSPYGFAFKHLGIPYKGVELSNFAVNSSFVPIEQGDITTYNDNKVYHLVAVIDVLEHLSDEQLSKALENISKQGRDFLFSIPFEGDPNLYNDKTHLQFHTKDEWKEIIRSHGIEVSDAPKEWLYSSQLLIGKKK